MKYNIAVNLSTSQKTVLFILDDFHIGGLASFVNLYTHNLNCSGYRTIVMGEVGDSLKDSEYFKKCEVISLPLSPWTENHSNLLTYFLYRIHFFLKFARGYANINRKVKIDAVHFNMTWSPLSILLLSPTVFRIPRVITFYGDFGLEHRSRVGEVSGINKIKRNLKVVGLTFVQWVTLFLSTKVIVFSKYAQNHVWQRFKISNDKTILIPGTIDKNIQFASLKLRIKKRSNKFTLLNISRFENRKGHDILLYAVDLLLKRGLNVQLIIRGPISGEIISVLKIYESLNLKNHISILYSVTEKERLELMKTADLFVMPSRELETFGLTIVESLACGTPVVGTPVGAIPEILSLVNKHLIAKSSSPTDLANAIFWYMNQNVRQRRKIAKKCQKVILKHFEQSLIVNKLKHIYKL